MDAAVQCLCSSRTGRGGERVLDPIASSSYSDERLRWKRGRLNW